MYDQQLVPNLVVLDSAKPLGKLDIKLVYLDILGKVHSIYKGMVLNPPSGYRFITMGSEWDRVSRIASENDVLYSVQMNILSRLFPPNLAKSYIEKYKKPPMGTKLTYSVGHLVFRKEPWIVDLEYVTQLTGYSCVHFKKFRGLVEKMLASAYCRKIICWTEASRKTLTLNMNCDRFNDKIEVVPLAVERKNFVKNFDSASGKIKLLFVGSVNIPGEFEYKGGKEVLEAFSILSEKYKDIELVIRSDIPSEVKLRYRSKLRNLKLIEGVIPWKQLEHEFQTADIFLFPAHATPGLAILDAMSYELPVITTNVWANVEQVEDGKTGFIIKKSKLIQYNSRTLVPNWSHYSTSKFMKSIKIVDRDIVNALVDKTSILVENENLRRRMGKAGRASIEEGKFSFNKRRKVLERVFDEALDR